MTEIELPKGIVSNGFYCPTTESGGGRLQINSDNSKVNINLLEQNKTLQTKLDKAVEVLEYGLANAKLGFPCLTVMPPIYTKDVFIEIAQQVLAEIKGGE